MNELRMQLKETLATVFTFYLKAHYFHWNVEGVNFYQHHKMFQKIYEDVYDSVDPLAEHIRTLSAYAPGSMERFKELTTISEETSVPTAEEMIKQLLADNDAVIISLNKAFVEAQKHKQQGIMNFLADRIDQHNKWGWFLRSSQ